MSRARPVYVVDGQKRITLGVLVEPGARFNLTGDADDLSLTLTPSPTGRTRVDDRRRAPLGRMTMAGSMFGVDLLPDDSLILTPLHIIDTSDMAPDLRASIEDYLVN